VGEGEARDRRVDEELHRHQRRAGAEEPAARERTVPLPEAAGAAQINPMRVQWMKSVKAGSRPERAHLCGDLAAVVGAVERDVGQHVADRARVLLALRVHVGDRAVEVGRREVGEVVLPLPRELLHVVGALGEGELGPDGARRGAAPEAREPEQLGADDVVQERSARGPGLAAAFRFASTSRLAHSS
jgi:hypothetical protein